MTEREAARFAWDQCAKEAHSLGWLHDWALSDLLARNPWRVISPGRQDEASGREGEGCPTEGCDGDARYAAPGRRHRKGCRYPLWPLGQGGKC